MEVDHDVLHFLGDQAFLAVSGEIRHAGNPVRIKFGAAVVLEKILARDIVTLGPMRIEHGYTRPCAPWSRNERAHPCFVTARADYMKRSTTGLKVRFFSVTISTCHGS
jgi:hypothetical protein